VAWGKVFESNSKIIGKELSEALYGSDGALGQFAHHIRIHRAAILAALVNNKCTRNCGLVCSRSYPADQPASQGFQFNRRNVGRKIERYPEETYNDFIQNLLSGPPPPRYRPASRDYLVIQEWNDCQVVHGA
jgi:hypothetical protein